MGSVDHSARVSLNPSTFAGTSNGKFLYVSTDIVYPGELTGFWSSRKSTEGPEPEGSCFNFSRSDFCWHFIGAADGTAILLTLDLTLAVVCASDTQREIGEALFSPRRDSLFYVFLAPWLTNIPIVRPTEPRNVISSLN
jgi:hypothetical protein